MLVKFKAALLRNSRWFLTVLVFLGMSLSAMAADPTTPDEVIAAGTTTFGLVKALCIAILFFTVAWRLVKRFAGK